MCELLVRVVDKANPDDPALDAQLLKRGDVVVACPDGHPWSEAERTNPHWRIVAIPGLSESAARSFLAPEYGDRRENPFLRPRAFRFALDRLGTADVLDVGGDDVLDRFKEAKSPLDDPSVLGPDPGVIG